MNPYDALRSNLHAEFHKISLNLQRARKKLADVEAFDLAAATAQMSELDAQIAAMKPLLERLERATSAIETETRKSECRLKPVWDPTRWFSQEQKDLRDRVSANQAYAKTSRQQVTNSRAALKVHAQNLEKLGEQVAAHRAIDVDALRRDLTRFEARHRDLAHEVARVDALWSRVDKAIAPARTRLDELELQIEVNQREQSQLHQIEIDFQQAANSYERRQLHDRCERLFDVRDPRAAASKLKVQREALGRDRSKVQRALDAALRRATLDVHKLVFDGNNICYDQARPSGENFIGIAPLKAMLDALADRYELVVIFDPGIRSLMRMDDQQLSEALSRATVYVMAPGQAADETIIKLADSPGVYAVTNDKFTDSIPVPAVVRDNRLIRHTIVGRQVFIHDLDVDVEFDPAAHGRAEGLRA